MRKLVIALAAAAALVVTALPASAAPRLVAAGQDRTTALSHSIAFSTSGDFEMELSSDTSCGVENQGLGNNVETYCNESTTEFYWESATHGYKFHQASNDTHCLQPYNSGSTYVTMGTCQAGDTLQEWELHSTGTGCELSPYDINEYMSSDHTGGDPIRLNTGTGWIRFTIPSCS